MNMCDGCGNSVLNCDCRTRRLRLRELASMGLKPLDVVCDHKGGSYYHCSMCCKGNCATHRTPPTEL